MPKQCPGCQQLLDDDARNCPICGIPVGHVAPIPEPVKTAAGESAPPIDGPSHVADSPPTVPLPPSFPPTDEPRLTKPALMAGVLLGLLSAMPVLNLCCLLWVGGAGVLAVFFLRTETQGMVSVGTGATLGLLTGLFGALVWQLLELPLSYISGPGDLQRAREMISEIQNLPPEHVEALEHLLDLFSDPLHPVFLLFSLVFKLVLCGILTPLGGVLGAVLFGKGHRNPP